MLSLSSGKAESCFTGGTFLIDEILPVTDLIFLKHEEAFDLIYKAHKDLVFASALIKIFRKRAVDHNNEHRGGKNSEYCRKGSAVSENELKHPNEQIKNKKAVIKAIRSVSSPEKSCKSVSESHYIPLFFIGKYILNKYYFSVFSILLIFCNLRFFSYTVMGDEK